MQKYLREPPVPPLMRSWVGNMLGLTLEVMVHARQFPSSSSRELLIPGAWHPPARASTWWAHPAEQFIRLTSASTAQSILVPPGGLVDDSVQLFMCTLLYTVQCVDTQCTLWTVACVHYCGWLEPWRPRRWQCKQCTLWTDYVYTVVVCLPWWARTGWPELWRPGRWQCTQCTLWTVVFVHFCIVFTLVSPYWLARTLEAS